MVRLLSDLEIRTLTRLFIYKAEVFGLHSIEKAVIWINYSDGRYTVYYTIYVSFYLCKLTGYFFL